MDESTFTAILAVLILGLFFADSGLSFLGAVALIPLASKVPLPI